MKALGSSDFIETFFVESLGDSSSFAILPEDFLLDFFEDFVDFDALDFFCLSVCFSFCLSFCFSLDFSFWVTFDVLDSTWVVGKD